MDKKDNHSDKHDEKVLKDLDFEPSTTHNNSHAKKPNKKTSPELKAANKKIADLTDELRRSKADFINYQNRSLKQIKEAKDDAKRQFLLSFLNILDDINAAGDAGELSGPLESISNKITALFESNGIKKFGKVGDKFDPALHEALIAAPESGHKDEQKISQVLQYGYMLNDVVVRPARVAVS